MASGLFPLYEVYDGAAYRINVWPDGSDPAEYFDRQRRFDDDEIDLDAIQRACSQRMRYLELLAEEFPYAGN